MKQHLLSKALLALMAMLLMSTKMQAQEPYAVLSEDNTVLTFYYDHQKEARGGMSVLLPAEISGVLPSWYSMRSNITTVVFDASFANCSSITSTSYWFYGCERLTTIKGIENLKTDNVTSMSNMFYGCSSLTSLDLSSFNTEHTLGMSDMFYGCSNLTTIYASHLWKMDSVYFQSSLFDGCVNLVGGQGTAYDRKYTYAKYARIDRGAKVPGYFTYKAATNVTQEVWPYAVLSEDDTVLTLYYDDQIEARSGMNIWESYQFPTWYSMRSNITTVVFDASFANCNSITRTFRWFYECDSLTTIIGIENLKTDNVTDMFCMFYGCRSLTSLDVSQFNTKNVTVMSGMFSGCRSLTSLDVSQFNTENVMDMSAMFSNCRNLTSLDVSQFNTENVTDMSSMFYNCSKLTNLNLSNFNTEKVTKMNYMFSDCSNLTSLDVSKFVTENVTNMSGMFSYCRNLTSLDVSKFVTENVTDMSRMFSYCSNLTTIYVSDLWSTDKVTNSGYMFSGCRKLVGGQGTAYDSNYTDATYARIDGGAEVPGYFTYKTNTGITGVTRDGEHAPVYNLGGQRVTAPQRGINIVGGKKVVVR